MQTTIPGFPRLGEHRELKFAVETYFKDHDAQKLQQTGKDLREKHWRLLQDNGLTEIPSNDFSFYDQMLDTACLLNIIPQPLRSAGLSDLDSYFALARGSQTDKVDVKARPMKKWFNTNYHYIVPLIDAETTIHCSGTKIFDEYLEAKNSGIETRPVLIGPFTFLRLSEIQSDVDQTKLLESMVESYRHILQKLAALGATWIQVDEACLVQELSQADVAFFKKIYQALLKDAPLKVLLQTYFGDIRESYQTVINLPFDGIGLDFVEGKQTLALVQSGFPKDKLLYAGVLNGKNIWRNAYQQTLTLLESMNDLNIVLSTSCSLLHLPYTVANETLAEETKRYFSFAVEKVIELTQLRSILAGNTELLEKNKALFSGNRCQPNQVMKEKLQQLTENDFQRSATYETRKKTQHALFGFPQLPTTTIGSFPQTKEVKQTRGKYRRGTIDQQTYDQYIAKQIIEWINWQEDIGLDVLVHGEFERNDMVEYFGQQLSGILFTTNGWVQSYGTRGVKPPIIWEDIERLQPMTVKWTRFAQAQTSKPVKGMLTGPVTILNWSFPREDIGLRETVYQLALAIRQEVLDLEAAGIQMIQIDEAALREKLPLRRSDWHKEYLDWAIPAFRLVHSQVKEATQIHTHMCYSEFSDIVPEIAAMDVDVISFESARSNLTLLDELRRQQFQTAVGPGVFDIHSPRIPTVDELTTTITNILDKLPADQVWINPDCGLKTRGVIETKESLEHMLQAVHRVREGSANGE
ncbi:5-methyltetrahydropteroyltriglutamate-homocysteine S-methyltransferase [Enterococcus sp. 8G7_MSG3316]|uniref:5-methyltetrahydropteroyltriglutamate--homocysteine methyltransferase n=1 Tax=Candidatus Enterococcus testudinis TaxID=1834191 RepID=A0A242A7L4_9ENTE|nr:5-methyltetrahydropteroyltriglutamate--homocysteine S-methyltransferase [Enterococcus sp. 8G7_MSG3316]OTN76942.1 5-methyltetrahydropteroyltriglutamate-homocysteine S-methyltransferase [Enterococcus sp. 8G7_MSG3316]